MSLVGATRYVARIEMIDPASLAEAGVRCALLDRDNTCVPRDMKCAPPEVMAWIEALHEAGISTCLVSNNFHTQQVERSAAELESEVVHHAMKPAPFAVWRALKKMGVSKDEAVLIGDQLFTDMMAGNLAGVRTILVRPQSEVDLWYTHVFRVFEDKLFLHGRKFDGE